jgi:predicted transcriptional regulator
MVQSVLERTTDLVIAQLATYYRSPKMIVRMLASTHANLMTLKRQEEAASLRMTPAPGDWQHSITPYAITCLECGASVKQLSVQHLRAHGLVPGSYRAKYGMPSTQPLAATTPTAQRQPFVPQPRG